MYVNKRQIGENIVVIMLVAHAAMANHSKHLYLAVCQKTISILNNVNIADVERFFLR